MRLGRRDARKSATKRVELRTNRLSRCGWSRLIARKLAARPPCEAQNPERGELRGLEPLTPCIPGRHSPHPPTEAQNPERVELRGLEPLTPCMPGRHSRYPPTEA